METGTSVPARSGTGRTDVMRTHTNKGACGPPRANRNRPVSSVYPWHQLQGTLGRGWDARSGPVPPVPARTGTGRTDVMRIHVDKDACAPPRAGRYRPERSVLCLGSAPVDPRARLERQGRAGTAGTGPHGYRPYRLYPHQRFHPPTPRVGRYRAERSIYPSLQLHRTPRRVWDARVETGTNVPARAGTGRTVLIHTHTDKCACGPPRADRYRPVCSVYPWHQLQGTPGRGWNARGGPVPVVPARADDCRLTFVEAN